MLTVVLLLLLDLFPILFSLIIFQVSCRKKIVIASKFVTKFHVCRKGCLFNSKSRQKLLIYLLYHEFQRTKLYYSFEANKRSLAGYTDLCAQS